MDTIIMTVGMLPAALATIIAFILGISLTVIIYQIIAKAKSKTFEQDLQRQINGAKREAENIIKSAQIDAAAEAIKKKEEFTAESNKIRSELHETEMRLTKREDGIERQVEMLQGREKSLKEQEKEVERRLHNVGLKEKQLSASTRCLL